jgi:L-asparaginase II
MPRSPYSPIFELTRGKTVESIHYGAIAVVDVHGNLLAWVGKPDAITFLRSTAKPFQALPLLEHGGEEIFGLSAREIAVMCASHSGTDEHVEVVKSLQRKTGVDESNLMCGVHEPMHEPTAERLRQRNESPTPNRHNCSGKHSGMLAYVHLLEKSGVSFPEELSYIDPRHLIQKEIFQTFADMCNLPIRNVKTGIDGCSAPNFAVPLRNAAFAFARLCDPGTSKVFPTGRAVACKTITSAMMSNPDMVGGPGRFDTRLMEIGQGHILSKGGAEAYQGIGLMPGALGLGSPSLGIAIKISDGDDRKKVCNAVTLEILRQLGALTAGDMEALLDFGPRYDLFNWRKVVVGEARPAFDLDYSRPSSSS